MTLGLDMNGKGRPTALSIAAALLVVGSGYVGLEVREALKGGQAAPAAIANVERDLGELKTALSTLTRAVNALPVQAVQINALSDKINANKVWTDQEIGRLERANSEMRQDLRRMGDRQSAHEARPHTSFR